MNDTAIFFAHHRDDERTLRNLRLLREASAGCEIIPIGFDNEQTAPGAVRISHLSPYINTILPVRDQPWLIPNNFSSDALLYEWFKKRPRDYSRYVWLEWDTLARQPIRDFFAPVWDKDYSAPNIVLNGDERWYNWRFGPEEARILAGNSLLGQWPLSGVVMSHACLLGMVSFLTAHPELNGLFCEMRMPTLAKLAGYEPFENSAAQATFHWQPLTVAEGSFGVFHPYKE